MEYYKKTKTYNLTLNVIYYITFERGVHLECDEKYKKMYEKIDSISDYVVLKNQSHKELTRSERYDILSSMLKKLQKHLAKNIKKLKKNGFNVISVERKIIEDYYENEVYVKVEK